MDAYDEWYGENAFPGAPEPEIDPVLMRQTQLFARYVQPEIHVSDRAIEEVLKAATYIAFDSEADMGTYT